MRNKPSMRTQISALSAHDWKMSHYDKDQQYNSVHMPAFCGPLQTLHLHVMYIFYHTNCFPLTEEFMALNKDNLFHLIRNSRYKTEVSVFLATVTDTKTHTNNTCTHTTHAHIHTHVHTCLFLTCGYLPPFLFSGSISSALLLHSDTGAT